MKLDVAHKTFDISICRTRLDRYRLIVHHDGMKRPAWYSLPQFSIDKGSIKLKTLEAFSNMITEAKKNYYTDLKPKWLQLDWIDLAAIDTILTDYLNGLLPGHIIKINGQDLPPVDALAREYEEKTWALKPNTVVGC
jgi:hypothetical protein